MYQIFTAKRIYDPPLTKCTYQKRYPTQHRHINISLAVRRLHLCIGHGSDPIKTEKKLVTSAV
jgi:hypothetical protein